MAVYKIPQDVEADDKFIGPLSFKQAIYCGIAGVSAYLSFLALTKGFWPALIFFIPVITGAGFLGFPWGRDQPTEVWLAARIRFFLKPRVRIWSQSGLKNLVTITAPKHVERHFTNGLSENEVSSRLSGLADLLDSRGWAVKNVNVNLYGTSAGPGNDGEDRLLSVTSLPQEVVEVTANDDVLDEATSPTAQHFEQMIKSSEQKHRQEVMDQLQAVRTPAAPAPAGTETAQPSEQGGADFWFLQQGSHDNQHQTPDQIREEIAPRQPDPEANYTTFRTPDLVAPHGAAPAPVASEAAFANQTVSPQDEQALLAKIHKDHEQPSMPYSHSKTIMPIDENAVLPAPPAPPTVPVTPPVDPAIINLASNDDLNVATLARQADKANEQRPSDGEVVISLR